MSTPTTPTPPDLAHQLGGIAARLDTIADDIADIKARVRTLELAEARHSTRLAILTSILGCAGGLLGSHVVSLLSGS